MARLLTKRFWEKWQTREPKMKVLFIAIVLTGVVNGMSDQ